MRLFEVIRRRWIGLLALTLCLPSWVGAVTVLGTDMTLNGNALVSGSNLQLTASAGGQVGSAWRTSAVSTTRSFTSTFSFQISGTPTHADGLSFAMQNTGLNAIGWAGGSIGVEGLSNYVNLTIRTFFNNQIGFGNNALSSKAAPNALGNCSSIVGTFTVAYQAEHSVLALYGTYTACGSTYTVTDSLSVNLQAKFGNTMFMGFTGATGGAVATQTITSWSLVSTGDLVMHHKFDGSTGVAGSANPDNTGNGFGGSFVGAATLGSSAPAYCGGNTWTKFSGGSRVQVPYNAALNPRPNFSVAFWARVDGGQGTWRAPIIFRDEFPTRGFNVYVNPSNQWQLWTGAGLSAAPFWNAVTAGSVVLGQWVHVAASFQATSGPDSTGTYSGTGTLYLNGVASATNTGMRYMPTWSSSMNVGANASGGAPFEGAIDDLRLYARALSAADVQSLIKSSCPGGLDGAVWWSRADALAQADNSDIVTWANDANAAKNLAGSATRPKFRNNNAQNINFNPVVEFTTNQFFTSSSMLGVQTWSQGHYVLVGYPTSNMTNVMVVSEFGVPINGWDGRFGIHWPHDGDVIWDSADASVSRARYTDADLLNKPSVFTFFKDASTASPFGVKQATRKNGIQMASTNSPAALTGANGTFSVGKVGTGWRGVLAEGMMILGSSISSTQAAQLESYLAVKYGATLGGGGATAASYLDSGSSTVWASNTGHHNNIVGLGRDDTTKLNQLVSRSTNAGHQITITTAGTMPSTASVINATAGGNAFAADRSFIVLGDNGSDSTLTTTIASGSFAGRQRSQRIWRVQVSGTPTQLSVCIPDAMFPASFLSGGLGDVRLNLANAADMSGANVSGATFTAETCVASGLGNTVGVAGRRATFSAATMAGLTGGVAYMAITRNAVDHIEITANNPNGVTCAPTTYTVKACSDAACTTPYTGGLTGTLTLTGTGVTANFPSGAAFTIASGNSSTTVAAQVTTPSTATVGATGLSLTPGNAKPVFCGLGVTANSTNACTMAVADAGFLLSVPHHRAGYSQTVSLSAVKKADNSLACVAAFTGTQTVNVGCSYLNPSTGTKPLLVGGAAATNTSSNPSGTCNASTSTRSLVFDNNGQTTTTVQYDDVGQVQLSVSASGSGSSAGLSLTGSANFLIAPFKTFVLSNLPGAAISAGSPFGYTVTAVNAAMAATPNFGRETPPESITMSWVRNQPTGANAVDSSFSTGTPAGVVNGAVNYSNASWSEVGRATLSARLTSGNYMGSGFSTVGSSAAAWQCASENGTCAVPAGTTASVSFDAGGASLFFKHGLTGNVPCTSAYFGDPKSGSSKTCWILIESGVYSPATGALLFKPHHFDVSTATACGSFSYAGQPFGVTVTAKNLAGSTTQNYDGTANTSPSFAKAVSFSDITASPPGSLSGSLAASAFNRGVASVAAGGANAPVYSFSNKLTAAQTISLRATDTDGVSSNGFTEGSMALRSGRLQMSNAFGSEKSSLQIPLQLQYWSGKSWVKNSEDTCTVIPTASVVLAQTRNHNNAVPNWSSTVSGLTLSGGSGFITLAAPSPSGTGTVDLAINLGVGPNTQDASCLANHPNTTGAGLPWLRSRQGNCATSFDRDPSARGTFGIYTPETQKSVHVREVF